MTTQVSYRSKKHPDGNVSDMIGLLYSINLHFFKHACLPHLVGYPYFADPLPLCSLGAVISGGQPTEPQWRIQLSILPRCHSASEVLLSLLHFITHSPPSLPFDCTTTMSTSKLPPRKDNVVKSAHENPVWTLSSTTADASGGERASPAAEPPLTSMCDVHARPDAVCCRTLKGDDERSLIDPDIVK